MLPNQLSTGTRVERHAEPSPSFIAFLKEIKTPELRFGRTPHMFCSDVPIILINSDILTCRGCTATDCSEKSLASRVLPSTVSNVMSSEMF